MSLRPFRDRGDAGRQLAAALTDRVRKDTIVLGIPRGGVEVGHCVARILHCDFSMIMVRKLPFPDNPESGFGAIAEDGSIYLAEHASGWLSRESIERIIRDQTKEVRRRISVLRGGRPLTPLQGRHVMLVDDGIAMGSTTQAAVLCCRHQSADRVTVAAPVASPDARRLVEASADEVVTLLAPPGFRAVADYYANWHDVSDEEVIALLKRAQP